MAWFDPPPSRPDPTRDPGDDDSGWPGLDYYGIKSEQFIVTPNPVVGVLYGPKGELLATYYERDDRFGFAKWAEDR